jgi:hypothetical protein
MMGIFIRHIFFSTQTLLCYSVTPTNWKSFCCNFAKKKIYYEHSEYDGTYKELKIVINEQIFFRIKLVETNTIYYVIY